MSSSTSSSNERAWKRCFLTFVGIFVAAVVTAMAFVVIADPFDTLHLSPTMDRLPITRNQRMSFPALARKAKFDSAIAGTSTVQLLEPTRANEALGGAFVNLSMDEATRYEQHEILRLFAAHHKAPRTIIVGIDALWTRTPHYDAPHGQRRFPTWMYDANPWNDYLPHLNAFSLRHAWKQMRVVMGKTRARHTSDGYRRFVPDAADYDLERARDYIYGRSHTGRPVASPPAKTPAPVAIDTKRLLQLLRLFPAKTEKIVMFPPSHAHSQGNWDAAKHALVQAVAPVEGVRVVDFNFESALTTTDSNFWDPVHYTVEIAEQMLRLLAASRDPSFQSPVCRVLHR